ncbi:hypothetical protein HMPREF0262_02317 [Clostridium sp. ATCC 29733]|nr:hypothetical protein HMPREF0262_02317 [Clostridium sp. ATCC 29733]
MPLPHHGHKGTPPRRQRGHSAHGGGKSEEKIPTKFRAAAAILRQIGKSGGRDEKFGERGLTD